MHELYFDQVVIFWIKYNEAPDAGAGDKNISSVLRQ